jgi:iron complex transport system permease protein
VHHVRGQIGWLVAALVATAAVVIASVALGARVVSVAEVVAAFTGAEEGIAQVAVRQRVPRTILALLVGASLGVAGTVMQGVTRNPLADPGILGVTSGAALAVVSALAFFGVRSPVATVWIAIAGAAGAASFVYGVGSLGRGGATPLKLTLAGAATSAAFSSLISAILLPRLDVMDQFRFWQIGGVGGASPARIALLVPFVTVGGLLCLAVSRGLNTLALGDELATGLGSRVAGLRLAGAAGAVLLCGAATAVAGPIAFIGLVVPHVCRLLFGLDHRWLVPTSAILGAALLTAADVLGRVAARPAEIDVGIVAAFVGAPVFIALVRRHRVRAP